MNNIKISQLDENLSPGLNAITVIVEDDVAKNATIQTIKETIFSDDVDLTGNLMVDGNTSLTGNLSVTGNTNLKGNLTISGNTNLTGTTTIVGDTQIVNTWSTPNNSEWKIVTYNGHYSGSMTGSTEYWFKFSEVPFSNGSSGCDANSVRGGIIEYNAYFSGSGCGTEMGQIMFSKNCGNNNDSWVVSSQDCDSIIVTDGDNDGFYFYNDSNGSDVSMMIQWTARLFYTEENFC